MDPVVQWLFDTQALRISPPDSPFWYTSGKIGPFYINTHFLFDGEQSAGMLLEKIDGLLPDKMNCPAAVLSAASERYMAGGIYRQLVDRMVADLAEQFDPDEYNYISGGERRDWFFSLILAHFVQKPHITLYKDLSAVLLLPDSTPEPLPRLPQGSRVLHIADLITEASSYERAWIPAVTALGGRMTGSLVVVDRMQGGSELLARNGVRSESMVRVDRSLFDAALQGGLIRQGQYDLATDYLGDPDGSMERFMKARPEFMQNALEGGGKTAERARLCVEKHFYGL